MADRVFELFDEYAAAYARGERPQAREYLERAGADSGELARLLDAYLARAPAPPPPAESAQLLEAFLARETPVLALRRARGVTRDALVDALIERLGLDRTKREKVKRYVHELETGTLDAERVDPSVWETLAEKLKARLDDVRAWRPPAIAAAAPTYFRADADHAAPLVLEPVLPEEREPPDEIDRLFGRG